MNKTIYLFRHSKPDFPRGVRMCLGRNTDLGICEEGRARAGEVREEFTDVIKRAGKVYSSPLKRAYETALVIAGDEYPVAVDRELIEMDAGEWDGLNFDEIKARYPELYVRRTEDMSISPPKGEEYEDAAQRATAAIRNIALNSESDTIVIVAHSGLNRAFLCKLTRTPYMYNRRLKQEYTSLNIIEYDTDKDEFKVKEIGYEKTCEET